MQEKTLPIEAKTLADKVMAQDLHSTHDADQQRLSRRRLSRHEL